MKKKHTNHTLKKAISLTAATTVLCTGIFTPDFFSTQSVTAKNTSQKTITVTDNSSTTTTLGTNITQFTAKAVDTNTTNTTTNVTAKTTTISIHDTMPTTDTTTTEAPASTPAATKKPTSTKTPATTKKPAATKKPVAAKKPQKKKSNITKITISAAGDCTLGSDYKSPSGVNFYAKYNEKKDPSYFFNNVKSIFKKDNLTLVNFEGTLTKRNTRADKTFAFKGNPSYLKILQQGNVDAVSFANNHCRDYGEGSYNDTIAVFKKNKDIKIIPCKVSSSNSINNYQPTPAKGAAKKRIIAKMNRFCKPYNLKFKHNGKLR